MGLLGYCNELRCARIGNGFQIKTNMEIILQENGGVHRKQHKVQFSVYVLVVLSTRRKDSLLLTLFRRKLSLMVIRFISIFLCAPFQLFGRKTLKIQSQLSIKIFGRKMFPRSLTKERGVGLVDNTLR